MAMIYSWKDGSRIRIDAMKAGREMEDIRRRNDGHLTPAEVLTRARSANSALHAHFEWDDSVAAEQHRLGQASELVRSIVIDVTHSNIEAPKTVRAFVSVDRDGERSYTSTLHAMSDKELRRQVLERAFADLEAWRKRHAELTEFARLFAVIDREREALLGS